MNIHETYVEIVGTYENTINRNEKNGWTRFTIRSKDECLYRNRYGSILCVGNIPHYNKGMPLKLTGVWETNNYGTFLNVSHVKESSDNETVTIEYLTGLIPGLGKNTAIKIVKEFGADIFSFVQTKDAENKIKELLPNINAEKLLYAIKNNIEQRKIYEYIVKYGGSYPTAVKISKNYGKNALTKLKNNPYKIGLPNGLSVEICDTIAFNEGMFIYDKKRIDSLVYEAILSLGLSGHTYVTLKMIYDRINYLTKNSVYGESIPAVIIAKSISSHKKIVMEKGDPIRIYSKTNWIYETAICQHVNRLINSSINNPYREEYISEIEAKLNITYGKKQREAFSLLKTTGIKILTGGPGTGKTTEIRGFIKLYEKMYPNNKIALCAPTGRAAQRASEATGIPALTIHRLLEFTPFGKDYNHKTLADPIDADMIIVDEVSMADNEIMAKLLGAIKNQSLVILVGDENQLESVGPGNILHDFISSDKIEVCRLDEIYRQEYDSLIINNGRKINKGNVCLSSGEEFEIYSVKSPEEAKKKLIENIKKYHKSEDLYYTHILTPVKKTMLGVYEINKIMQDILNNRKEKLDYGFTSFKIGDKIMMLRNNYEKGYFNGDIGVVKEINENGLKIVLNNGPIQIEREDLEDIMLCYASSVHKSQGSEFPVTIVILPENPSIMLKRRILYTAITRAKEKVIIIAVNNALRTAIWNKKEYKRNTGLYEKLKNLNYELIPQRFGKIMI